MATGRYNGSLVRVFSAGARRAIEMTKAVYRHGKGHKSALWGKQPLPGGGVNIFLSFFKKQDTEEPHHFSIGSLKFHLTIATNEF